MVGDGSDLAVGWVDYRRGRLADAHAICRDRIARDPDDGRAWELLGLVFHDSGQFVEAADALERASLLVPVRPEARIGLATCYGKLRRRRLATELFLELMLRGELSPPLMLQVAAGLDQVDEPRLSMEACRRVADADPGYAQVHYDMGYYAARSGYPRHITEALVCRAIDLEPGKMAFRVGLATLLIRWDRAAEAYEMIRGWTDEQWAEITCGCCLRRLAELCRAFGAADRARRCLALAGDEADATHDRPDEPGCTPQDARDVAPEGEGCREDGHGAGVARGSRRRAGR